MNNNIKKLLLLSIISLQLLNLSCGPSLIFKFQNNEKNISQITNISYDNHTIFFKNVIADIKKDEINGKLFYTPNFVINAKTKINYKGKINGLNGTMWLNLVFMLIFQTSKDSKSYGFTFNDAMTTFFLIDAFSNFYEIQTLINKDEKQKDNDITLTDKINYHYFYDPIVYSNLNKDENKKVLSNVSIKLSEDCNTMKEVYELKISSDGLFSLPYSIFNKSKICEFKFNEVDKEIKMQTDIYIKDVEYNIFSDEILVKYF
ncbi:MAG: hypothetical protein ACK4IX_05375 [Candidatus Sericytochromatia bacterium]